MVRGSVVGRGEAPKCAGEAPMRITEAPMCAGWEGDGNGADSGDEVRREGRGGDEEVAALSSTATIASSKRRTVTWRV